MGILNPMESYYLITCWYAEGKSFHYQITNDVERWIEKMQQYEDTYVLINALPVSWEFAQKWDGRLHSM